MTLKIGYREVAALTLDKLASTPKGQYEEVVRGVLKAAVAKGLIPPDLGPTGADLSYQDDQKIHEWVQEAMWDCLIKRLLMFGMDGANPNWPFYRLTEHGRSVLKGGGPQPYDPDGFLAHFNKICPTGDPEVVGYLEEAVTAFNAGCVRSAAVMLGCGSEKLILLLCDAFRAAISDPAKKTKFASALESYWQISRRYEALHDRLEEMAAAKKLSEELRGTVESILPAGYDLLRRCRNSAGHPKVPGMVDTDTVFMNLRMFIEYARRVTGLIEHFGKNPADW